jgi:hypothetical protein
MAQQMIDVFPLPGRQVINGKDNLAGLKQCFGQMRAYKSRTTCYQKRFFLAVALHAFTPRNWDGSAPKGCVLAPPTTSD